MTTDFEREYRRLNEAQKAAVDAIDGPVLVVAGPGTGKTQLLSLRVANILKQTDTPASSILCLTFTNFAAANMRARLNSLIGAEAHRVIVRTFHSFAADVMNQYPDFFWNGAKLVTAPDAVQIEIIQNILAKLPFDNPLASRFAGSFTAIADVQKSLGLAKEAGLTPQQLAAMVRFNGAYLDEVEPLLVSLLRAPLSHQKLPGLLREVLALPEHGIDDTIRPLVSLSAVIKRSCQTAVQADGVTAKTTNTGLWKKRWVQTVDGHKGMYDERRRNDWWFALAGVYEDYRSELHERGYYDYADMIVEVISQLQNNNELRAGLQERYLYLLIDEFQDTNSAQLQLAHLIASHVNDGGSPNLMAVGDDDQSIFAFNGAELNNMLNFQTNYPSTQTIVLTQNYRSTQAILDIAEKVIGQAEDRLVIRRPELVKKLTAVTAITPGTIVNNIYPTRAHELQAVAEDIVKLRQRDTLADIAVLARSHDSLRRLSLILNELEVPISYEQQNDVFDNEVVQLICLISQTVLAIRQGDEAAVNAAIAQLIRFPVWQLPAKTLWELAIRNYKDPHWLINLLEHADPEIAALANWLLWLSQQTACLPLLLEYIIGLRTSEHMTSPIKYHYASLPVTTKYIEALSGLHFLIDVVREFAGAGNGSLEELVRFFELNRGLERAVTDTSWFTSGDNAVQLMTVHKAKGLEFDHVYILDAVEDSWQPRRVSRRPPANLPLQPYGEQYDDYVRLMYVATTRAKHSLFVASFSVSPTGKLMTPSPLIGGAIQGRAVDTSLLPSANLILETAIRWPRLETDDEQVLLRSRLEDFSLSATGLIDFLNVASAGPQSFLEQRLLRLPTKSSAHMSYGTAVHAALQTAQLLVNQGSQDILEGTLSRFDMALSQQLLPPEDTERYGPLGRDMLTRLFREMGFSLPKNGVPECNLSDVFLGDVRLNGKLDHLIVKDNELTISDYKTGSPLHSLFTKDQTKAVKAWTHRTQLLFYALLASGSSRFADVRSIATQMIYVEAESPKYLYQRLIPEQADMERLEAIAVAVWRHVQDLNFPNVSAYAQDIAGIRQFEDDLIKGVI